MADNLRDKIARALFIAGDEQYAEQMAKAWDAPGPHGRQWWFNYADAVLSVIDVDAVRAEAKVEVLREVADELNRLANTKSLIEAADKYEGYYAGVRAARQGAELLTRGRADRIARAAGIETGESK